jgi:hypothetical protein
MLSQCAVSLGTLSIFPASVVDGLLIVGQLAHRMIFHAVRSLGHATLILEKSGLNRKHDMPARLSPLYILVLDLQSAIATNEL